MALDGIKIEQVKETKYLGLIIQENLKWDIHIRSVINKLNAQIPTYYILKQYIPQNNLEIIYKSLSLSIINYGIELYCKSSTPWTKQLQKTQNRLLKILFSKPKQFSTNLLHKQHKILKIDDRVKLRHSLIIHRSLHNNATINWTHRNIERSINVHNRNLRNHLDIQTTAEGHRKRNKILEQSAITWNSLDNNLKSIINRNKFKSSYEKVLIELYE